MLSNRYFQIAFQTGTLHQAVNFCLLVLQRSSVVKGLSCSLAFSYIISRSTMTVPEHFYYLAVSDKRKNGKNMVHSVNSLLLKG